MCAPPGSRYVPHLEVDVPLAGGCCAEGVVVASYILTLSQAEGEAAGSHGAASCSPICMQPVHGLS